MFDLYKAGSFYRGTSMGVQKLDTTGKITATYTTVIPVA